MYTRYAAVATRAIGTIREGLNSGAVLVYASRTNREREKFVGVAVMGVSFAVDRNQGNNDHSQCTELVIPETNEKLANRADTVAIA